MLIRETITHGRYVNVRTWGAVAVPGGPMSGGTVGAMLASSPYPVRDTDAQTDILRALQNDGRAEHGWCTWEVVDTMPAPCAERVETVRQMAERAGIRGQSWVRGSAPEREKIVSLGMRIAWDAPAASEYMSVMLSDAVDLATLRPGLADAMWHHAAGAAILGPLCCGTPASHRDALVAFGRDLDASAREVSA